MMRSRVTRIWPLAWRGALAVFLTLCVGGAWSALLVANLTTTPAIPWAVPVMALILWLAWQYLGGRWWPGRTSEKRRRLLRANPVSGRIFAWAIAAGLLAIVALTGLWIVLIQVVKSPGNPVPDWSAYPLFTTVLVVVMASLVSSIAEEAGLRGYFQVTLERELPAPVAIVIVCLAIAPGHSLTQGFVWTTILFYFFADLTFGVMAYLTNSILPGIVVHSLGLLTFFTLVWPNDASRRLVSAGGVDVWFWIHAGQAIVVGALAIIAFTRLARVTQKQRERM